MKQSESRKGDNGLFCECVCGELLQAVEMGTFAARNRSNPIAYRKRTTRKLNSN